MNNPISSHNYHEVVKPKAPSVRKRLYEIIYSTGTRGINSKDLEAKIGKAHHKWSGRLSEMVEAELIKVDRLVTIDGCWVGVWVAMEFFPKVDQNGQTEIF